MPGSRFHPYLSTQDEARLASMTTSATYTANSSRPYSITNKTDPTTESIPKSSVCPPHLDSPRHALSAPYTVIEGVRWQPDVGWSAGQYSSMEQNLLAMEQQRLALHQQQWMEAPNQQQQMEALMQHRVEAFRHQQRMEPLLQQQKMTAVKQQQQRWMETPNLTYMADNSQFIGRSQEYNRYMEDSSQQYNRYMEDSSQQYIRYMDKLRHISEASVPSVPTGPVLSTLSVPLPCQSPMQDQPLNLSLKDRFEDSTRGSSDLSTTHSSSSDSMSTEKFTEYNMSPEQSLVKLSHSNTKSSLAKHTLPKKRSYDPNSAMITGLDKLSHPPSLVKLSGSMKSSSEPHLAKYSVSKKPSEPSSVLLILSKKISSEPPLAKLSDSEKRSTEPFPGRLIGPGNCSSSNLADSKKSSSKPSSLKLKDFEKSFFKTSSEKLTNSKTLSSEQSSGFAVKLHPTKPIEVGGLDLKVAGLFPHLKATELGTIVLWNFLWALLADPNYQQVLRWIDHPTLKFKVFQPQDLARLWGIVKKNTSMNLEKLLKVIDLYVKKDILKELDEKFVFQFAVMPEV